MLRIQIIKDNEDNDLLYEIFKLRYRAYLAEGAINENQSKTFHDEYDRQPNKYLLALYEDGKLIGSMRSTYYHPDSKHTIPEFEVYFDDIKSNIPAEAKIISGNRFVIDPSIPRNNYNYSFWLLKYHMYISYLIADYGIAAVRLNHIGFYSLYLMLARASDAKIYPRLLSKMYLLSTNIADNYNAVCSKYERIALTPKERKYIDGIIS